MSLVAQACLAAYFQAVQWFPLGKWNLQCPSGDAEACGLGHQGLSVPGFQPLAVMAAEGQLSASEALYCLAFTLPFALFLLGYVTRRRWLMWWQVPAYIFWLAFQVASWWVPYVFGADAARVARYRAVFGEVTQLLPAYGNHLPPDGLHLVLQFLLLLVITSGVIGLLRTDAIVSRVDNGRVTPA